MPLGSYSVNAAGCARTLVEVEEDTERRAALSTLQSRMADAQGACSGGSGAVVRALEDLWENTLLLQAQAAETQIGNAVAGARQAVHIIATADQEMAAAANKSMGFVDVH